MAPAAAAASPPASSTCSRPRPRPCFVRLRRAGDCRRVPRRTSARRRRRGTRQDALQRRFPTISEAPAHARRAVFVASSRPPHTSRSNAAFRPTLRRSSTPPTFCARWRATATPTSHRSAARRRWPMYRRNCARPSLPSPARSSSSLLRCGARWPPRPFPWTTTCRPTLPPKRSAKSACGRQRAARRPPRMVCARRSPSCCSTTSSYRGGGSTAGRRRCAGC